MEIDVRSDVELTTQELAEGFVAAAASCVANLIGPEINACTLNGPALIELYLRAWGNHFRTGLLEKLHAAQVKGAAECIQKHTPAETMVQVSQAVRDSTGRLTSVIHRSVPESALS